MERIVISLLLLTGFTFQSCLLFKVYNGRAAYKDTQREVELSTDTTIIVGNKAVKAVQPVTEEIEKKATLMQ